MGDSYIDQQPKPITHVIADKEVISSGCRDIPIEEDDRPPVFMCMAPDGSKNSDGSPRILSVEEARAQGLDVPPEYKVLNTICHAIQNYYHDEYTNPEIILPANHTEQQYMQLFKSPHFYPLDRRFLNFIGIDTSNMSDSQLTKKCKQIIARATKVRAKQRATHNPKEPLPQLEYRYIDNPLKYEIRGWSMIPLIWTLDLDNPPEFNEKLKRFLYKTFNYILYLMK